MKTAKKTAAFKMSGGIYTLTTLELHVTDMNLIAAQLIEMTDKAPHFFNLTAVILSFAELEVIGDFNLQSCRHLLSKHGMILVAIRGGGHQLQKTATTCGIAWLPTPQTTANNQNCNVVMMSQSVEQVSMESAVSPNQPVSKTRVIDHPVRSGQQIYSPGDLIITSSVSSGAELLAEGNIHVYGSLRGRALAGISGDANARIFCQQFEAELISVCGQYRIPSFRSPKDSLWGVSVQVSLDHKGLQTQKL